MMMSLETCRLVMPLRVHHGQFRTLRVFGRDIGFDLGLFFGRQGLDACVEVAQPDARVDADLVERRGVLRQHVGKKDRDDLTEDDRIRDLHHGRFELGEKEHALRFRVGHLRREERT